MESRLLATICVLLAGVAVTGATTTPAETYWRTVLPNTPMPQIIKDRLQPGLNEMQWGIDPKAVSNVKGTLKQGINPSALADMHDTLKGGIHPDILTVYIGDIPQLVSNDSTSLLFLLEKDLHPGKSITLDLRKIQTKASFLPRKVAEAIPFSSTKLPDIFNQFLIRPQSAEAVLVKRTIGTCEGPTLEGEDKSCVTSLESMIDFATSKLGKDVMVMATEVEEEETPKQEYSIGLGVQKVNEAEKSSMACHAMNYMYTVYYCHSLKHTTAYTVPLVGADGTKAKAVAFCHKDTATWNPNHLAFQLLNVKPGTVAICHFFQVESIIWLPK